ncbi:hypothetical protein QJQ45_002666 [Haematococcus lacustris]|nr:hypothetical protein QJQ45_002666 [Haematococcus lacustris]
MLGLPYIRTALARTHLFVFNPAMQTGMGIDHGAIQAVSAASEPKSGQLATDKLAMWKLTGGQVLQHLAAASSAGTSLEATLHHNTTTPVTWDAVWRVYMDPKLLTRPAGWKPPAGQVEQRLVRPAWSQQRGQSVRGLVWCPVVPPRRPPQAPRSGQSASQPAASKPGPSTPLSAKRSKRTKAEPRAAEPTKGKGKGKAAKAKPAPQPGRWLDRDCNAALNMQRIGESRWRPLELCFWPDQGALPAKGKEYPGLGYKRLRDKPPKAQEQQQQPAEAQ